MEGVGGGRVHYWVKTIYSSKVCEYIYIENVKIIPCFAKERFNQKVQMNCSVRTN